MTYARPGISRRFSEFRSLHPRQVPTAPFLPPTSGSTFTCTRLRSLQDVLDVINLSPPM
ncbi:hypothetical protein H257_14221 [Aphanomyces astaci]|uniref:Uncharacterized protein n=1 Tax=Aphanomyces astaci TaxID=112090 RepID=W4FU59_APHAT|nr:hypothetical protein H257_14221 [Aphanomyces astaci]ETV70188.1 hypothetical protein H257_14221 [Aphanomyces astaci]|eukprot:XP_009840284.1 hypothetical protein H257_14221 [Aphanomyces astaci]